MEPPQISFLLIELLPITLSILRLVLQRFTRKSQLRRLYHCIDYVLPVKHRNFQESCAANGYVSQKDIKVCIYLDLGMIMQRST